MKAFPWRRRGPSQGWPRPQEPCPTPGRSELVDGQCPSAWVSCESAVTPRVPRSLCGPQGDPDVKTLDLYRTYTSLTPSPAWKAGPGGARSSQRTVEGYIAYGHLRKSPAGRAYPSAGSRHRAPRKLAHCHCPHFPDEKPRSQREGRGAAGTPAGEGSARMYPGPSLGSASCPVPSQQPRLLLSDVQSQGLPGPRCPDVTAGRAQRPEGP